MKAICLYCGLGCAIEIESNENRIISVHPHSNYPVYQGELCILPTELPSVFNSPNRLTMPLKRINGEFIECSWDDALEEITAKLKTIIEDHGPDAFAFYGGATNLTEEYYVMNKLIKGGIGTNNVDCSTRLCMASTAAGFISVFGADAPPTCYADIELADCFLVCGNNMAVSVPVLFNRLLKAKRQRGAKLIVVDPRKTLTAEAADLHLMIRPGTDVALNNTIAYILLQEGFVDEDEIEAHASGFHRLKVHLEQYTPESVAPVVGCDVDEIITAARMYGEADAALTFWFQGYNHSTSALHKNNTLHNLAILTGNVGRPGGGPFSVTGESNALGNRYVGALSHLLPGMRQVSNPKHRQEIEKLWKIPEDQIQFTPGKSVVEMIYAIHKGEIKALWVMNTNPAASLPDTRWVQEALEKLDLLFVQDIVHPTETTEMAHVILPAAQWYEKEGTAITSERRVEYIPKVIDPPGEALPDWKIIKEIAIRLGYGNLVPYESEEEIFDEWRQATAGTLCDMTGISYERIRGRVGIQIPCPNEDHPGTERLFTDLRFLRPDGRAALLSRDQADAAEMPDADYPYILLTGRILEHFNTRTRTACSTYLNEKAGNVFIEVNIEDAKNASINDGDTVIVSSRRGQIVLNVRTTDLIRPGALFIPWHFGKLAGKDGAANILTNPAIDPNSKQPEYKFCAVNILKAK